MNHLQIFENTQFGQLRTVEIDGEPWFIAADVCRALELDNVTNAVRRLDDDEKALISIKGISRGNDEVTAVNEAGLYSLVLSSRKKEAKEFKRWVTHEVIPSIRKHGAYMTPETIQKALTDPDFIIQLATQLKTEQEARKQLEEKVEADKPKVIFADAVSASKTTILVGELAKLLRQNGIEMGQNRLFKWLRDKGYLMKTGSSQNTPTQRAMELGLFSIKETTIAHADGYTEIKKTTKITPKGQQYFINLFLKAKGAGA